jgi:hypothetical protein
MILKYTFFVSPKVRNLRRNRSLSLAKQSIPPQQDDYRNTPADMCKASGKARYFAPDATLSKVIEFG